MSPHCVRSPHASVHDIVSFTFTHWHRKQHTNTPILPSDHLFPVCLCLHFWVFWSRKMFSNIPFPSFSTDSPWINRRSTAFLSWMQICFSRVCIFFLSPSPLFRSLYSPVQFVTHRRKTISHVALFVEFDGRGGRRRCTEVVQLLL